MRAKEYMMQYRVCVAKIARLEQNIERLRDQAGGLSAIQYDKDRVQSSHDPDRMGVLIARISDLEEKYSAEKLRCIELMDEIESVINKVNGSECQTFLHLRYIELDGSKLTTLETIMDEMHYSWSGVNKIHKRALKEVERIINGISESKDGQTQGRNDSAGNVAETE